MKTEHDYCECGGVDNGVGIQHEPHCPAHTAAAVLADVGQETKNLRAENDAMRAEVEGLHSLLRIAYRIAGYATNGGFDTLEVARLRDDIAKTLKAGRGER